MNLEPLTGPGSPASRRRWFNQAFTAVMAAQKHAGRHCSTDEHEGKGTVINFADTSARRPQPAPGTCCNRDVTEISTMTLSGTYSVDCSGCTDSCTFSRTWTRINNSIPFNGTDDQFKLYFGSDPPCQLFALFSQPDFLHPVGLCTALTALFQGSVSLDMFQVFPDDSHGNGHIHVQFQVALGRLGGSCVPEACNGESTEFVIAYTSCDVSALIGDLSFSKFCGAGNCISIEGHVTFA